MDTAKLLAHFEKESIKLCYAAYRAQKKMEREEKPLKPLMKRIVLQGAPSDLAGELVIRIKVVDGTASYIELLERLPDALSESPGQPTTSS
jgi:hypothetical protein